MQATIAALAYALIGGGAALFMLSSVFKGGFEREEIKKLWALFFATTTIFFLAPNANIFFAILLVYVLTAARKTDPLLLSMFLLLMFPAADYAFGRWFPGIAFLIPMSVPMFAGLVLLLPAVFKRKPKHLAGMRLVDIFAFTFIFGTIILTFGQTTFTNDLRAGVITIVTLFATYVAFSRIVRTSEQFERLITFFVAALFIGAIIAIICQVTNWNFYTFQAMDLFDMNSRQKWRGGLLRVVSTYGFAYINFGLVLMCATVLGFAKATRMGSPLLTWGFVLIGVIGVFMTASRGPYVGGVAGALVLIMALRNAMGKFFLAGVVAFFGAFFASFTEAGQELFNYIPFIGNLESENYRVLLWQTSWPVIQDHWWTGEPNFRDLPEMQVLVQGEGIIDVVNAYIGQALEHGVPMTLAYVLMQLFAIGGTVLTARQVPEDHRQWRVIGAGLAGALACFAIGIATTSMRFQTEQIGFLLVALNVAYVRISRAEGLVPVGLRSAAIEPYGMMASPAAREAVGRP